MIVALREKIEAVDDKDLDKLDPGVTKNQFKKWREEILEALKAEEEKVGKKNRWYHQAFRGIAWGPTILFNVVLAMFL